MTETESRLHKRFDELRKGNDPYTNLICEVAAELDAARAETESLRTRYASCVERAERAEAQSVVDRERALRYEVDRSDAVSRAEKAEAERKALISELNGVKYSLREAEAREKRLKSELSKVKPQLEWLRTERDNAVARLAAAPKPMDVEAACLAIADELRKNGSTEYPGEVRNPQQRLGKSIRAALSRFAAPQPDIPPPDPAMVEQATQAAREDRGSTIDEILTPRDVDSLAREIACCRDKQTSVRHWRERLQQLVANAQPDPVTQIREAMPSGGDWWVHVTVHGLTMNWQERGTQTSYADWPAVLAQLAAWREAERVPTREEARAALNTVEGMCCAEASIDVLYRYLNSTEKPEG